MLSHDADGSCFENVHFRALSFTLKIRTVINSGLPRWRVTWRVAGRTRRKFLKTQKAAQSFAASTLADMERLGAAWVNMAEGERQALMEAQRRATERGYTVLEACRFFEAHGPRTAGRLTIGKLIDECLKAKRARGLRSESLRILGSTFKQFRMGREETPAADVSADDIARFLSSHPDWGQWRRRGALIDLNTLFAWGVKAGHLVRNPAKQVERPVLEDPTPAILTPERCLDLLQLTQKAFPSLLGWLVLCLFAGVRPAEVERLRWSDVDTEAGYVRLDAAQTKTRLRRLVKIRPNLKAWLAICRKSTGMVCAANYAAKARRLRKRFGGWSRDVLRHSYCSYELARSKNLAATALEAGNSPDVLLRHYRELVGQSEARAFWSIFPSPPQPGNKGRPDNILPLNLRRHEETTIEADGHGGR